MRVLLSCLQSRKQHPLPAYEFWRSYFVHGCAEAGIEYVEIPGVDWAEGLVHPPGRQLDAWRAQTWDTVLQFVREEQARHPIHFFLGYLYPKQVEKGAVAELQRMGIPCVNFFCDNVREFCRVPLEYQSFALNWVPEFEALPMYRSAGLPHLHAPMPCWVPSEFRAFAPADIGPPTFIGSADILRRELLGRALHAGADLVIRGPGWVPERGQPAMTTVPCSLGRRVTAWAALVRAQGAKALYYKIEGRLRVLHPIPVPPSRIAPAVFGPDYFRVTQDAMITIGINRVPSARASNRNPLSYSRLRDIEAPMLGACYLTEWTAGLGDLYELGVEIESYRTPEELCFKIDELKKDRPRRRLMRERAQRRALSDHSVARSLRRICERLGLQKDS